MLTRRKVTARLPSRQNGLSGPFWPQGGLVPIRSRGEVRFGRDGGADCTPLPVPPLSRRNGNGDHLPQPEIWHLAYDLLRCQSCYPGG